LKRVWIFQALRESRMPAGSAQAPGRRRKKEDDEFSVTRSGKGQKSVLERGLSIFTPVHAGEGTTTLLMSLNVFLLLTSYYVIKPVREALILSEGGAEAKSYLVAAMAVARVGKTLENASDYSINKTVLQMLFLPTSTDIKYKSKQVVDSFFQRFGDVASAVVVLVGTQVFVFGTSGFAMANVVFVLLWLGLIAGIAREHRASAAGNRPRISEDV